MLLEEKAQAENSATSLSKVCMYVCTVHSTCDIGNQTLFHSNLTLTLTIPEVGVAPSHHHGRGERPNPEALVRHHTSGVLATGDRITQSKKKPLLCYYTASNAVYYCPHMLTQSQVSSLAKVGTVTDDEATPSQVRLY